MNSAKETTDPIKGFVSELRAIPAGDMRLEGLKTGNLGDKEAAAELAARQEAPSLPGWDDVTGFPAQKISDDDTEEPWPGDQAEFDTWPALEPEQGPARIMTDAEYAAWRQEYAAWRQARTAENILQVKQTVEQGLGGPSTVAGERPSYDDLTEKMEAGNVRFEVVDSDDENGRFYTDLEIAEMKRQGVADWQVAYNKGFHAGHTDGYLVGLREGERNIHEAVGRKWLRS